MTPFITVLITTYNYGPFIEQAIESVVAEDYPSGKVQIVIVDDGSTDELKRYPLKVSSDFPGLSPHRISPPEIGLRCLTLSPMPAISTPAALFLVVGLNVPKLLGITGCACPSVRICIRPTVRR